MKDKTNKPNPKKQFKPAGGAKVNLRLPYLLLAVIVALTLFIYLPSLDNKFTNWDDRDYVTENPLIAHPENVRQMLTTPVSVNYHPLTMYSLALDYKIAQGYTEVGRAKVYHTTNLILHLLNVILVFYFLLLVSSQRVYMSLAGALLFAIHPMHVESVAWISERKDVLYTFFFLLSLIAYLKYVANRQWKWLVFCFVCFVFSLASKPAAVVLPLVLLAIDFFKGRKPSGASLAEKIPFFILSLALGVLTFSVQAKGGAVALVSDFSIGQRILFGFYATMMYLVKLFFPAPLSNLYPFPNVKGQGLGAIFYVAPVLVVLFIGALIYFSRYSKVVLFGLAFFFINIILVLQFFEVGQSIISDRYSYISYIGLFIMATWWLDADAQVLNSYWKGLRPLLLGIAGILCISYLVLTSERIKVWQNSETLWTDAINKFPDRLVIAYGGRGYYYLHANEYDKAMADYNKAISLNPDYAVAYPNRGNIFFAEKKYDSAILDYNKALAVSPDLWRTLSDRGAAKAGLGDLNGALQDLNASIKHDSTNISALINRALVLSALNDHIAAIDNYNRLLSLDPNNDKVYNALGVSYQQLKRYNESIDAFNKAIALFPNSKVYYTNRSISWAAIGRNDNADADLKAAGQIK